MLIQIASLRHEPQVTDGPRNTHHGQMTDARKHLLRTVLRRIGQLITGAAIVFLVWELYQQWGNVNDWRPSTGTLALLVALGLGYPAALMLLAFNWVAILRTVIAEPVPTREGLLSYTKTQIAKYVPGNVLHFVGRHIYLKHLGFAHRPVAFAAVLEVISQLVAASCAIGIALVLTGQGRVVGWIRIDPMVIVIGAAIVLALATAVAIWRGQRRLIRPATVILSRSTVFMLLQGLIFAAVLYAVSGTFVALAIPVAIFAWLVGFVTPGAPGGVAVREAMIVNLLGAAALSEDALIAALLFRVVTTVGDLLLYVFGNVVIARRAGGTAD